MGYLLSFIPTQNTVFSDDILYIYDFGNKRGFLYKNEFTIYKILKRNYIENINEYAEIYDTIPMNTLSIEQYPCIYENNIYKIPYFSIIITELVSPLPHQQPSLPQTFQHQNQHSSQQFPPQVRQHQPVLVQKNRNNMKIVSKQTSERQNGGYEKRQQEQSYQQPSLVNPISSHTQWISLDQVMRTPLPSTHQSHNQVPLQEAQYSQSSKKHQSVSQVRQPQKKGVAQLQYSKKSSVSQNPVQELVKQ